MNGLTKQDVQNIIGLLSRLTTANITFPETKTLGALEVKLTALLNEPEAPNHGSDCPVGRTPGGINGSATAAAP